mmetsp:Transcript_87949/g.188658  ORF Transcript_87949/g.188658 Transcript_87949/m.188658 type:complete len:1194 (-) Transcript_87949:55-3636(-)
MASVAPASPTGERSPPGASARTTSPQAQARSRIRSALVEEPRSDVAVELSRHNVRLPEEEGSAGREADPANQAQHPPPGALNKVQASLCDALFKLKQDVDRLDEFMNAKEKTEARQTLQEDTQNLRKAQANRPLGMTRGKRGVVQVTLSRNLGTRFSIDLPQDSEEEEEDSSEAGQEEHLEEVEDAHAGSSSGDGSGDEMTGGGARKFEDQNLLETWKLEAAHELVQHLMASLNTEERMNVLQELGEYYSEKQAILEEDRSTMDRDEGVIIKDEAKADKDSADIQHAVVGRELRMYQVLRNYHRALLQVIGANEQEEARVQEFRDNLISQMKDERASSKGTFTAPDMLEVVARVQKDIEDLKAELEIEENRAGAYEHAHKQFALLAESGSDSGTLDPVTSQVVKEVSQWQRDGIVSQGNWYDTKDAKTEEADPWQVVANLSAECENLRKEVTKAERDDREFEQKKRMMREQEVDQKVRRRRLVFLSRLRGGLSRALAHEKLREKENEENGDDDGKEADGEEAPVETEAPAPEAAEGESLPGGASSLLGNYDLFSRDVQEKYEATIARIQDENTDLEKQIREYQELQKLARDSVPTLEDSTRRLLDVAKQAKRNFSVGAMPEEESDEAMRLKDLKMVNEDMERKLQEDHQREMDSLRAEEEQLTVDIKLREEECKSLKAKLEKEEKEQENLRSTIAESNERLFALQRELKELPRLNMKDKHTRLDIAKQSRKDMDAEMKDVEMKLQKALALAKRNNELYEEARNAARNVLLQAKDKLVEKERSKAGYGTAKSETWSQLLEEKSTRAEARSRSKTEEWASSKEQNGAGPDAAKTTATRRGRSQSELEGAREGSNSTGPERRQAAGRERSQSQGQGADTRAESGEKRRSGSRGRSASKGVSGSRSGSLGGGVGSNRNSMRSGSRPTSSTPGRPSSSSRPRTGSEAKRDSSNAPETPRSSKSRSLWGSAADAAKAKRRTSKRDMQRSHHQLEEIEKLEQEEHTNKQVCAEYEARAAELEGHVGIMEKKIMEALHFGSRNELEEALAAPTSPKSPKKEEVPAAPAPVEPPPGPSPALQALQKELKMRKKQYDKLRGRWFTIKDMAKKSKTSLDLDSMKELHRDILKICDEALVEMGREIAVEAPSLVVLPPEDENDSQPDTPQSPLSPLSPLSPTRPSFESRGARSVVPGAEAAQLEK